MAQHGLLPSEIADGAHNTTADADADDLDSAPDTETMNAFQQGFINGQASDDNNQEFYEKF